MCKKFVGIKQRKADRLIKIAAGIIIKLYNYLAAKCHQIYDPC